MTKSCNKIPPFTTCSPLQAKFLLEKLFDYLRNQSDDFSEGRVLLTRLFISGLESDLEKYKNDDPHSSSYYNDLEKSMKSGIDYCKNVEGPLCGQEKIVYFTKLEDLFIKWLSIEKIPAHIRLSNISLLGIGCNLPVTYYNEWLMSGTKV